MKQAHKNIVTAALTQARMALSTLEGLGTALDEHLEQLQEVEASETKLEAAEGEIEYIQAACEALDETIEQLESAVA